MFRFRLRQFPQIGVRLHQHMSNIMCRANTILSTCLKLNTGFSTEMINKHIPPEFQRVCRKQITRKPTIVSAWSIALIGFCLIWIGGCASITNDANQQIQFRAPECKGMEVKCTVRNKRGLWDFEPPEIVSIRRSDDPLVITCSDKTGRNHVESMSSRMGGKIVASAVFLDFGIVDAITDKHREYPSQIAITMCE